jgi:hypothetical protein
VGRAAEQAFSRRGNGHCVEHMTKIARAAPEGDPSRS